MQNVVSQQGSNIVTVTVHECSDSDINFEMHLQSNIYNHHGKHYNQILLIVVNYKHWEINSQSYVLIVAQAMNS